MNCRLCDYSKNDHIIKVGPYQVCGVCYVMIQKEIEDGGTNAAVEDVVTSKLTVKKLLDDKTKDEQIVWTNFIVVGD